MRVSLFFWFACFSFAGGEAAGKDATNRCVEFMRAHERKLRDHEASMEAFAKVIAMPAKPARPRQISFMAPTRMPERGAGKGNGNGDVGASGGGNGNGLLMTPPKGPGGFSG